jgi:hypothetical protein
MENMTTPPDTLTQFRAVCPVCFAQQATRGGRMVAHGYRRPRGWQQNVNNCRGVGRPHFGTPEGLAITRQTIEAIEAYAAEAREAAATGRFPIVNKVGQPVMVPTAREMQLGIAHMESNARHAELDARDLRQRADAWQPAEPVAVTVKKSAGPLVHFRLANWGRYCAASRIGAMKGDQTTDRGDVTCPKCHARLAAFDARQAAQGAQQ